MPSGSVVAIWIKRGKRAPMDPVPAAELVTGRGIAGNTNQGGKRQVTLIEEEAWEAVQEQLGAVVDPRLRRANVMVRGISLEETRGCVVRIGECEIAIHGETRPCELMDESHPGLRRALATRWRGGAYGEVLRGGIVRIGDAATLIEPPPFEKKLMDS